MIRKFQVFVFLISIFVLSAPVLYAAEGPYCEVAGVNGDQVQLKRGNQISPLKTGDKLQKGDRLIIGKDSSVDVAFDEEWKNVVHVNQDSRLLLRFINPTRLELASGDVYSKLDNLPKGSSFEIATPTAIAAVRGTRYRTVHQNGSTTVYNDSETSLVYVYHLDANGNRAGRPTVLKPGESITIVGEAEVYDPLPDELEESRNREDQDQLNDDLSLRNDSIASIEPPSEQPGNYGNYN